MNFKIALLLLAGSLAYAGDKDPVSCDCPKVECPACQHSEGLSFYSEKCGEGGMKTRSCSKPKCVEDITADAKCAKPEPVAAQAPATKAVAEAVPAAKVVGAVKVVKGSVQIVGSDGVTKTVGQGDPVHEKDAITTDSKGGALIEFQGGNQMHVLNNTKMTVQEYEHSEKAKNAVFNLLRGKVRSQVKEKFDGKTSKFEVTTPGVVAGVRGTDFVVSNEEDDKITSRVETLSGTVHLNERMGDKEVSVEQGHAVTYVIDNPTVHHDSDWSDIPQKGSFNPVYEMTEKQVAVLDSSTYLGGGQLPKKPSQKPEMPICKAPVGHLNQCAWKCVNNPSGSTICRTDRHDVSCVRSRCNANGEWTEETRLPAAAGRDCKPFGVVVDSCDY